MARLSEAFTRERSSRRSGYMNEPWARRAYLAWFAPMNASRVAALLRRLGDEGVVDVSRPLRVADLGSGPLSASIGLRLVAAVEGVHAVDRSRGALKDGRALLSALDDALAAHAVLDARDLRDAPAPLASGSFDVVVIANALAELADARRGPGLADAVVEGALRALAPGGRVIVVEPGTRLHARSLMALRDRWVAAGTAQVLSPCPEVERCPLLLREGDWCHQELDPRLPPAAVAFARLAGVAYAKAPLSHLVLARPGEGEGPPPSWRFVGGVMEGGGRERRYVCTPEGLVTLTSSGPRLPRGVAGPRRGEALRLPVPADVEVVRDVARGPRSGETRPSRPRPTPRGGKGRGRS